MRWMAWAVAIIVFAVTTSGLGYLCGVWIRRLSWSVWLAILMCIPIALICPAVIVVLAAHDAAGYQSVDALDPADAPAYVFMGALTIGTILFVPGFFLAFAGALLGWRPDLPRKEYSN
jgi:hypothetical protein